MNKEFNKKYILQVNNSVKKYLKKGEIVVKIFNTRGGIANKVLKLETNLNNYYIFKIYKKRRNHLLANQLMKYLSKNGIKVVMPINKEYIYFENTDCLLYKYIDNVETIINDKIEDYILEILYKISNLKDYKYLDEHLYSTKCDYECRYLKSLKDYKLDENIIKLVINEYERVRELKIVKEKSVVYSDISTSNLLNARDGYYLIDFDETRITSKLYDLMVVLMKFYVKEINIDFDGMKKFIRKYKSIFYEYSKEDFCNIFSYYVCKQLLEKFYDYEGNFVDIYSPQQMQDNFNNWIFFFKNLDKFYQMFKEIDYE